jgi:hypothetical protein
MRSGCGGCLLGAVFVLMIAVAAGGVLWGVVLVQQVPEIQAPVPTSGDSARAQHKVFQLMGPGRGRPAGPIVFTEAEINALVTRQLDGQLPLASPAVRLLADDTLEIAGRVPLQRLLTDAPLSWLANKLPAHWRDRPLWLRIRAHALVERGPRSYLVFEPREFAVGRLPLPTVMVRLLLDPATLAMFRWALPDHVEAVTIEAGRATIRVASSR